jgi:SpoVK/Ycf46/Vps4 family AAA+-type ATPase
MLLNRDDDDNNLNNNNLNFNNKLNYKLDDESYNESSDNLNNKTNNQNNNISSTDKISNEYMKILMNNAKKPTLSCFLNILDGIIELPITIIFTTNKIDKIDPAVIRRFGIIHEFKRANHKVIIDMLNIFFTTEMTNYYYNHNNYNNLLNNITEYTLSHSEIYYIIQQSQSLFECIDLLNKESHKNLFRIT